MSDPEAASTKGFQMIDEEEAASVDGGRQSFRVAGTGRSIDASGITSTIPLRPLTDSL
jgi:hypothetical protein